MPVVNGARHVWLLVLWCALLSLPLRAQPTSQPNTLPTTPTNLIEIQLDEGSSLDADNIRALLKQKPMERLDEDAIREDIKSIFALGGIFDVQVEMVSPYTLRYIIHELPQDIDFEIKGNKPENILP